MKTKMISSVSKIILTLALPALAILPCQGQWNYPTTKTVDASDTYFGKTY